MSWTEEKLNPDEAVVFQTHPHWSIFLRPLSFSVFGIFSWWLLIPAFILLFYNGFIFYTHQILVTNNRLIQKRGLYYIRINDWPLQKIDSVICTGRFKNKFWNSGTVILIGIAIPKTKLKGVGHPQKLRDAIYSQLPTS